LGIFGTPASLEAPLRLQLQPIWILQQPAHFLPDGGLDEFTLDLWIVADSLSSEAITIRPGAAVIDEIFEETTCTSLPRRFPVICVPAFRAGERALKQIAWPSCADSSAVFI
jgi:hypothetical protein